MNEAEKDKKAIYIKLAIYLIVILIAIVVARHTAITNNKNINNTKKINANIIEKIKSISDTHYTAKIYLTLDDDAITLEYQRINEIDLGTKKYHGTTTEYLKKDNNYYKLEESFFVPINDFQDFDYDKTFIELQNIKKLLEIETESENYNMENYKVLKMTYKLQDVLKIYNEYHDTNTIKYTEGNITLEIFYNNDTLEYIKINTTDLYNTLNEAKQKKVIYKIELANNKEENIDWLLEKIK